MNREKLHNSELDDRDLVCSSAFWRDGILEDMESPLQGTYRHLVGEEMIGQDAAQKRIVKKSSRRFFS